MTTITYTVRDSQIDEARNGTIETFEIRTVTSFDPLVITPQSNVAESADGRTFQRTTVSLTETLTLSSRGVRADDLEVWREFYRSQMLGSDPFTVDATDIPGVERVVECFMTPQDWSAPRVGCRGYEQTVTAQVIG